MKQKTIHNTKTQEDMQTILPENYQLNLSDFALSIRRMEGCRDEYS